MVTWSRVEAGGSAASAASGSNAAMAMAAAVKF